MALSTIFQLYCGFWFYWWKKLEYICKWRKILTHLVNDKLYHKKLYVNQTQISEVQLPTDINQTQIRGVHLSTDVNQSQIIGVHLPQMSIILRLVEYTSPQMSIKLRLVVYTSPQMSIKLRLVVIWTDWTGRYKNP